MKRYPTIAPVGLAAGIAMLLAVPAQAQRPDLPQDSDAVRIELEVKLTVPLEDLEAVWSWLQQRYRDPSWLNSDSQRFRARFGDEKFSDTYFDTPDLYLLTEESGIRHRQRRIISGPSMEKDGRQLVQIKLNRGDETGLARSEIKFTVPERPQLKSNEDLHPMLRLIRRNDRPDFMAEVQMIGINPYELSPVLTVLQDRRRVYLSDQAGAFATLTLDDCTVSGYGADLHWVEVELELNEIRYTEADAAGRAAMEQVIDVIQADLQQAFPSMVVDQTPKYNKAFAGIESGSWLPVRQLQRWQLRPDEFIAGLVLVLLSLLAGIYALFRWVSIRGHGGRPASISH